MVKWITDLDYENAYNLSCIYRMEIIEVQGKFHIFLFFKKEIEDLFHSDFGIGTFNSYKEAANHMLASIK